MHKYFQGEKFGRLTLVRIATESTNKYKTWECLCDCGKTTFVHQDNLKSGQVKSCGCLRHEILVKRNQHGKWNGETLVNKHCNIYKIWGSMISRCYKPSCGDYKRYGARGITVCDEWKDNFLVFLDWALINGWQLGLTIDRIDNNQGYTSQNCRWTDRKTQNNNRRSNRFINIDGETHTLAQWSEISGIQSETIAKRINARWDISRWFIIPTKKNNEITCE